MHMQNLIADNTNKIMTTRLKVRITEKGQYEKDAFHRAILRFFSHASQ